MQITTRQQFVSHRNAMYSKLAEMRRLAPHMTRVEARSGAFDDRTGTFRGAGAHAEKIADLYSAYKVVCDVSALQDPQQADFDRAAEIFARWDVRA
jgi:hypothetical protein